MKRWLLIAAIFLLVGAVVNVAVAWGLFFYSASAPSGWRLYRRVELEQIEALNLLARHIDVPVVRVEGTEERMLGMRHVGVLGYEKIDGGIVFLFIAETGWPVKTVGGRSVHVRDETDFHWLTTDRYVPLRPLWSGFIVNTLIYAALLWSLFALRQWNRLRRRLCRKCAYPMGESGVCSECGTALPSPKVTAT